MHAQKMILFMGEIPNKSSASDRSSVLHFCPNESQNIDLSEHSRKIAIFLTVTNNIEYNGIYFVSINVQSTPQNKLITVLIIH
jgi:hypothetical protein